MKKSLLFFSLSLLTTSTLVGCRFSGDPSKIDLSYGSLIDTTYTDLDYATLEAKTLEEENFVLVTYPGKDSTCACWRVFEMVIEKYAKEEERIIYAVDVFQVLGKSNEFKLSLSTSAPSIAFFNKGKLVEQIAYSTKSPQAYYKDYANLVNLLEEKTNAPQVLYVDNIVLDTAIADKDDFVIIHTYSSCPDCTYCLPNVVLPFSYNNELETKIWVIDLNEVKKDKEVWQAYKDKYQLSNVNNQKYGYNTGYVPTAQAYKNGELVSASVYFNDTISFVNNEYVITDSFYTQERLSNLTYLEGLENTVLKGLVIPQDDLLIIPGGTYIGWKQDKANEYHKPLLDAFLTQYTK